MKREGRQHGMVRSYRILPPPLNPTPGPRFTNRFDSPPTAGIFTKVSTKPTNHSKFTGKCGRPRCDECHVHPACKSKDKGKGNQKIRSSGDGSDYGLLTLRVVGARPGLRFSGWSATGILDHLDGGDQMDGDDDDDGDEGVYDGIDEVHGEDGGGSGAVEMDGDDGENVFDDDDDKMSFCEVGIAWEQVEGEEDWCLVGEM